MSEWGPTTTILPVLRTGALVRCVVACVTTPIPALPDDCPGVLGPAAAGVVPQPLDLDRLLRGSDLGPGVVGSVSCLRGGWSLGGWAAARCPYSVNLGAHDRTASDAGRPFDGATGGGPDNSPAIRCVSSS